MAYEELASSSSSYNNDHSPVGKKRKAGRKKFQETRHPIYKGVRQRNSKWVCELRRPKKKSSVWVGTFSSPKMAAIAYDVAALALKGESAALNFPELTFSLPRVTSSSSISHIRTAAIEAAGALWSTDTPSSSSLILNQKVEEVSNRLFIDEEELFNMPAIIAGMAEGLILTPPGMQRGFSWEEYESTTELSLWSDE